MRRQGAAKIFTRLMSNADGANPLTFPAGRVVGWTWTQFLQAALAVSADRRVPVNPLALIHDGQPDPLPAPDTVIQSGDLLSLIVHPDFDYPTFEAALGQTAAP